MATVFVDDGSTESLLNHSKVLFARPSRILQFCTKSLLISPPVLVKCSLKRAYERRNQISPIFMHSQTLPPVSYLVKPSAF